VSGIGLIKLNKLIQYMNVQTAISKLRVMLGAATEEVKEVAETKMAEATLVDGAEVYTEGELQAGAILFVRAGEGADEDPFAPEGRHETTDGLIITVGESGEITNVEEKSGEEESVSEAEESFEEEEEVIVKEKDFDLEGMLEGIATMLEPYTEEIKELKEELSVLTSRFNEVADEPAAKKVANTFSQEAQNRATTAEARFERLVSLRKSRK
jgi:hypothetical protein